MDESITSTESMNAARPETRIGSYRVLEPLGIGGMSSVFRAVHAETNQEVALKVLTRSLAKNATLLQRFLREARSAETLEHPTSWRSTIEGSTRGGTTWFWNMSRAAIFTTTSSVRAR